MIAITQHTSIYLSKKIFYQFNSHRWKEMAENFCVTKFPTLQYIHTVTQHTGSPSSPRGPGNPGGPVLPWRKDKVRYIMDWMQFCWMQYKRGRILFSNSPFLPAHLEFPSFPLGPTPPKDQEHFKHYTSCNCSQLKRWRYVPRGLELQRVPWLLAAPGWCMQAQARVEERYHNSRNFHIEIFVLKFGVKNFVLKFLLSWVDHKSLTHIQWFTVIQKNFCVKNLV